jgi:asparagine synthase (glutamine-hydrolysing)
MSGIFGCYSRDGQPVQPDTVLRMRQAMAFWGPDGGSTWCDGPVALGQLLLYNTPESIHEKLPRWLPDQRLALTAEARIDNRDELCQELGIPTTDRPEMPDGDLVLHAYLRWGEVCVDRLLGDWSFAVWHPAENRLFVARDHHGNTSLFYYSDERRFVFASSKKAVLALDFVPKRVNELAVARILMSKKGDGVETEHESIFRLPPAHTLTVTPERLTTHRYWRLEETPLLKLKRSEDYVEGLREVLTEAVRCRLRSYRPVGVALSGGLDSGSVASLAARELAQQGKRLPAYSSVPLFDFGNAVGPYRFGDETPYIKATAEAAGNIDIHYLRSGHISPIAGIRRLLEILDAPTHSACNAYWMIDILETAGAHGIGTLLTGQGGNATISWIGRPWITPGCAPEQNHNWLLRFKHEILAQLIPPRLLPCVQWMRRPWAPGNEYAIAPRLEQVLFQAEKQLPEPHPEYILPTYDARLKRCVALEPGRSTVGAFWGQAGAAFGMEVRDPTLDKRVVQFVLAVPNREYTGPTGADRFLLRRAMKGCLPDSVLGQPRRGRQAADLIQRLKASSAEVDCAVRELENSPDTQACLDLDRLKKSWRSLVEDSVTGASFRAAVVVLTRGLMVGLFLSGNGGVEMTTNTRSDSIRS